MTERCFLGEKRVFAAVYASSALSQLVLCFWDHLLAVILDQTSLGAVRWLPHREGRCVEASLVDPKNFALHHVTSPLCCLTCPLSSVSCLSVVVSVGVLPRLPDSDKMVSLFFSMASKSVDTR